MNKCYFNNSRTTRWILSIQEYKFDIIHCKGMDNIVTDILSRYPENVAEGEITDDNCEYLISHMTIKMNKDVSQMIKNIGKYQLGDSKLKIIIDKLRSNCEENDSCKFYKYRNDKLYRKCKGRWKLCIPTSISSTIIAEIHQMYGHLGTKKCTKMIQEYFTFDRMTKRISEYIRTCDKCQCCKDTDNRNLFGGTRPILPTQKGDLVSGDFYGPLPMSAGGVRYLFVLVDNFTKFIKLYTLRRATTTATLRRVRQCYNELGTPKAILTDNGTQFTSKQWVSGLYELQIKPRYTAIRNPCANLAERINRQLSTVRAISCINYL